LSEAVLLSFNSAGRQEIPAAKKRNNLPSGRFVLSYDRL
jgi:hypothetical protein